MELLEDIPTELHNLVCSYLGRHPVAELVDEAVRSEVTHLYRFEDATDSDLEEAVYYIRLHKRNRLRRNKPSYWIYEMMDDLMNGWENYYYDMSFVEFALDKRKHWVTLRSSAEDTGPITDEGYGSDEDE